MAPSCPAVLPERLSLLVAGGGPAGFMAAISAAEAGVGGVHLLEATPELLHKVRISGGGRCNVTHACWDPRELAGHYPRGSRALRGPFSRFAAGDALAWFADHGLELVEEADGRLFPRANRSSAVIDCLRRAAAAAGVQVHPSVALQAASPAAAGGFLLQVRLQAGEDPAAGRQAVTIHAERLVLATGSHPSGRRLAASLGHTLVPPVPSLFTLALAGDPLLALAGVSMQAVGLSLDLPDGSRLRQRGPVLITHWGLSGPATLRLTAFAARDLQACGYRATLQVDWSGGRSAADLEVCFQQGRTAQARRLLANWRPWPELSRRLWQHLLERAGVEPSRRWADLTRAQQQHLLADLRGSRHRVSGRGPFGEEFVTAGGIPLGEVDLARMESRRRPGLYLVGELLDVDGVTGGFNFQHCWSSGWLVGQALRETRRPH
jgi:predicted Rossmann fold flavoprotein